MSDEREPFHSPLQEALRPKQAQKKHARTLPPPALNIARRLRIARLAAGLTQQQLAGQEFSKGYISAIECGQMIPSLEALTLLAQRLGVTRAYLLGEGEDDPETLKHNRRPPGLPFDTHSQRIKERFEPLLDQAHSFLRDGDWYEALQLLGESGEPPNDLFGLHLLDWYWLSGWALALAERSDDALRLLQGGVELAERLSPRLPSTQHERLAETVVRLHHFLGMAYCALDQTPRAYEYHHQCQKAIGTGTVRDPFLKLLIWNGLGRDALILGRFEESISAYTKAVALARELCNSRQRGLAFWGLGAVYQESGNLQGAKESYLEAIEAFEEQKNLRLLAQVRNLLGLVHVQLHEFKRAEQQFRLSLEVVKPLEDYTTWAYILGNLAALYVAQSRWEEAIEAAETGLQVVKQRGDARNEGQLHLTLATIYEARKDQAAAEQELKKALECLKHHDLVVETHARYARFLEAQGRFQEAYEQMCLIRSRSKVEGRKR